MTGLFDRLRERAVEIHVQDHLRARLERGDKLRVKLGLDPTAPDLHVGHLVVLDTLTPRERRVLQLRFGLIDGHQRTLEEVGKRFGVTRERIRQIEAKALRKLRHPSRSKKLRDYLE